jgi:hypothetical protein
VAVYQYEQHPIGKLFPLFSAEELSKLAKDITKQGLLHPIAIYQGKILEGWNRYRALQDLDIIEESHFTTFEGTEEEAIAYVVGQNMLRRHLTDNQRKQIAGDLLAMEEAKKAGRPSKYHNIQKEKLSAGADEFISKDEQAEKLAEQFHVTKEGVESAAKLRKHAPEVADAIKAGEGTVRKAARAIKAQAPKITADDHDEAMAEIEEVCGKEFLAAIKEEQVAHLKDPWEIRDFAELTNSKMCAFMPGLLLGWTVKQCERWTHEEITAAHSFAHAIHHAQSLGGSCDCEFNFGGHVFRYRDERTNEERAIELPEPPPIITPKKKSKVEIELQPTREQFVGFAVKNGVDATAAGNQWDYWNADGWCTYDGRPIVKWHGLLLRWARNGTGAFGKGGKYNGNGQTSAQERVRQKAEAKARQEVEDNK